MALSVDSNKKGLETVSIRSVVVLFNSAQTITAIGSQETATNVLRRLSFQPC